MTNQAVEAVTDKAISEIGKKLGLDSATTANKDSVKEKVKEKAVEKALDFLKKKIKYDIYIGFERTVNLVSILSHHFLDKKSLTKTMHIPNPNK